MKRKMGEVKKDLLLAPALKAALLLLVVIFGSFGRSVQQKDIIRSFPAPAGTQTVAVLLNNQAGVIPIKELADRKIASINIGTDFSVQFDEMLRNFAPVKSFAWGLFNSKELSTYTTLILQIGSQALYDPAILAFIKQQLPVKEVIIAGFGDIAALQRLDGVSMPVFWSPAQSIASAEHAAQVLFGGEGTLSRLSETISPSFPKGAGYSTWQTRLRYIPDPAAVGVDSEKLSKIDGIVEEAIQEHALPGAVVMVVKQGNVIFNKAYGRHTYEDEVLTRTDDIFDLASVTKIGATTIAAMRLFERQKLDLNSGIGKYLPDVLNTNKSNIPVKDVMLHQAGFVNLDFTSDVKALDHSPDSSYFYPIKVADNYYLRRNFYQEKMWPKMLRSPLPTRGQYVYSDISMYMMKEIIEHQSGMPLNQYVQNEFYAPLGMRTAGYNPRRRFAKEQIVPTEQDTYFRKTLLQGYVHDQGAALVDGVSGHAGLFASANDLAILNQMLLNGGTYGGVEYFRPETVDLFTKRESAVSYRGYGFDRANGHDYPSKLASAETFGHTGYTGTCVWVDPKYKLVYIFLSNRVYPSATDKINKLRIRPRIQDVIYSAIIEGEKNLASVGN